MHVTESLADHFLIAMPTLADPNFTRTVTYMCEHSREGSMGIVINRPLPGVKLGSVLASLDIDDVPPAVDRQVVYGGGPVQQERGFVIHEPPGDWEATHQVTENIAVTSSCDILAAIAGGRGPNRSLVAFGYAGWGPGQLERELAENSWLSGPADPEILFNLPEAERWRAAAALLGVDLNLLSTDFGHA